jgi:hypothetical protein
MGYKIKVDIEDNLYNSEKVKIRGISSSCYCCNQQIHTYFEDMSTLPYARIGKEHYYVFICNKCEEDVYMLSHNGVENVSYDLLWFIQEDLKNILTKKKKKYTREERNNILLNLYAHYEKTGNTK